MGSWASGAMSKVAGKIKAMNDQNNNAVTSINEGLKARQDNIKALHETNASEGTPAREGGSVGGASVDNGSNSSMNKVNPKAQYGDRGSEQRIDTSSMVKPLSKGAKIKKARIVKVHAGETVLPRAKAKTKMAKGLAKGLQTV
jgi:hypothetical protein